MEMMPIADKVEGQCNGETELKVRCKSDSVLPVL